MKWSGMNCARALRWRETERLWGRRSWRLIFQDILLITQSLGKYFFWKKHLLYLLLSVFQEGLRPPLCLLAGGGAHTLSFSLSLHSLLCLSLRTINGLSSSSLAWKNCDFLFRSWSIDRERVRESLKLLFPMAVVRVWVLRKSFTPPRHNWARTELREWESVSQWAGLSDRASAAQNHARGLCIWRTGGLRSTFVEPSSMLVITVSGHDVWLLPPHHVCPLQVSVLAPAWSKSPSPETRLKSAWKAPAWKAVGTTVHCGTNELEVRSQVVAPKTFLRAFLSSPTPCDRPGSLASSLKDWLSTQLRTPPRSSNRPQSSSQETATSDLEAIARCCCPGQLQKQACLPSTAPQSPRQRAAASQPGAEESASLQPNNTQRSAARHKPQSAPCAQSSVLFAALRALVGPANVALEGS